VLHTIVQLWRRITATVPATSCPSWRRRTGQL